MTEIVTFSKTNFQLPLISWERKSRRCC